MFEKVKEEIAILKVNKINGDLSSWGIDFLKELELLIKKYEDDSVAFSEVVSVSEPEINTASFNYKNIINRENDNKLTVIECANIMINFKDGAYWMLKYLKEKAQK